MREMRPDSVRELVRAIQEAELAGGEVIRVVGPHAGVVAAIDLILRLRAASADLSEEEMLTLLELLPL